MATVDRDASLCVGREPELRRMRTAVRDTLDGRGVLLLVVGEPGIGKTRLLEALAADALREGASVAWGRCWEAGGAPAYWPWIELLRALAAERGPEALAAPAPSAARAAAALVPELAPRHDEPGTMTVDAGAARFELFDGLSQLFLGASATQPLVLLLEDLHAADPASLLLLAASQQRPTSTRARRVRACAISSSARRLLPMPGSPTSRNRRPRPAKASSRPPTSSASCARCSPSR
jgi:predicted ATPase